MKYYIVFDTSYKVVGFLHDKMDVEKFKEQRDMSRFIIKELREKDMNSKLKSVLDRTTMYELAVERCGYLMFPREEEYFNLSFDQLIIDIQCHLKYMIQDRLPFLKLSDEEKKTVDLFLFEAYNKIKELCQLWEEGDDSVDISQYFKEEDMIRKLISQSGG